MRVKLPRLIKNKSIWIPVLIVLLILTLLCLRGWIRNSVVPAFVDFTYGKQLEKTADRQFGPVKTKLEPFGFKFKESPGYSPNKTCGLAYFYNFKETVVCSVSFGAKFIPTTKQQEKLAAQGDELERWLTTEDWTRERTYYGIPLKRFFGADYASASYKKKEGSAECFIAVNWQKSYTPTYPATLEAFMICSRKVKFFGGSNILYDPPLF